jgi:hypothetical protein
MTGKSEVDEVYTRSDSFADEDRRTFERRVREFLK